MRPTAFYVGRKRPITELSPEQQKKIRDAYRYTGFAYNDSEEGICICTTEEKAIEACKGKIGWFYMELPIDECLLEQTADFKGAHSPASDVPHIPLEWRVVDMNDSVSVINTSIEAIDLSRQRLRKEYERRQEILKIIND